MLLFVGLGNPGSEYAKSRHNIGFMAVDNLVRRYNFSADKSKFKGVINDGIIDGQKVLILRPETYMNLSGQSVLSAASFYKIHPDNIFVFHDDMDIALGKIKVKKGGGSAGHNGIKSIDGAIGNNYSRIRIGVGRPATSTVVNFVLGGFSKDEDIIKDKVIDIIADNISVMIKDGNEKFAAKIGEELKNGI